MTGARVGKQPMRGIVQFATVLFLMSETAVLVFLRVIRIYRLILRTISDLVMARFEPQRVE
jgi:hypothetical protein